MDFIFKDPEYTSKDQELLKWATNSIINEYTRQLSTNGHRFTMAPLNTITFAISNYFEDRHLEEYTPGDLKVDFPNKIQPKDLFQGSEKISHGLAHHFMWSKFKDFKYCNNCVHAVYNQNIAYSTKNFRKGVLGPVYKMVIYDLNYMIIHRDDIEAFCKTHTGSPQPYF